MLEKKRRPYEFLLRFQVDGSVDVHSAEIEEIIEDGEIISAKIIPCRRVQLVDLPSLCGQAVLDFADKHQKIIDEKEAIADENHTLIAENNKVKADNVAMLAANEALAKENENLKSRDTQQPENDRN